MTVNAHAIRAEAHVTVGSIIQRDAGIVIERWTRRALQDQPDARRVHHDALLDHLPDFLQALGRSLAESDVNETSKHRRPARLHGEQRWEVGWSLTEVMQDYQILRLVLVAYLEETMDRPLHSREVMAIGLALDEAVSASVTAYVRENEERFKKADQALRLQADLLNESNRRKDEFLAVLGHELRNPMAAIRNAVDVLADPGKVEWVRGLLGRQVLHMTRMVEDLLDVSRIAAGKFTIQRHAIDFSALVRTAVEDVRPLVVETGLTLGLELPAEPVWVEGDATRLTQVVSNLLHNAAKFTPGGGAVAVQVVREVGGARVLLSVRDTGIGIEPRLLPHVFETFMQADRSLERSRGGLGLGLALVKGVVELHGGAVAAASAGVNLGSELRLWLPVADKVARVTKLPKEPSPNKSASDGSASDRVGLRILLIEDNRDSAESLKMLLEMVGHKVVVANSGPDGVSLARQQQPDVVLCDLGLPGMSGLEVAQALRSDPATAALIMIAISGHGSDADQEQCRQAGFALHMTKPVDPALLQEFLALLSKSV